MARISTYAIDGTPELSDKVLGTDSNGLTTKNYQKKMLKIFCEIYRSEM